MSGITHYTWAAISYIMLFSGFGFGYWCAKHPLRITK